MEPMEAFYHLQQILEQVSVFYYTYRESYFFVYHLVVGVYLFGLCWYFILHSFFSQVNLVTNELFTVEAMEKSAEVIVKNFLFLIHLR